MIDVFVFVLFGCVCFVLRLLFPLCEVLLWFGLVGTCVVLCWRRCLCVFACGPYLWCACCVVLLRLLSVVWFVVCLYWCVLCVACVVLLCVVVVLLCCVCLCCNIVYVFSDVIVVCAPFIFVPLCVDVLRVV